MFFFYLFSSFYLSVYNFRCFILLQTSAARATVMMTENHPVSCACLRSLKAYLMMRELVWNQVTLYSFTINWRFKNHLWNSSEGLLLWYCSCWTWEKFVFYTNGNRSLTFSKIKLKKSTLFENRTLYYLLNCHCTCSKNAELRNYFLPNGKLLKSQSIVTAIAFYVSGSLGEAIGNWGLT